MADDTLRDEDEKQNQTVLGNINEKFEFQHIENRLVKFIGGSCNVSGKLVELRDWINAV